MDFGSPRNGLRTREAVSGAVSEEMVAGSLLMFSVIYLLLVLVWVFVLNTKIHAGPEEAGGPSRDKGAKSSFYKVAAEYADAGGPSLTESRRETEAPDAKDD